MYIIHLYIIYYFYSYSIISVVIKNRIITNSNFAPGADGDLEAKPESLTRHNKIIGKYVVRLECFCTWTL